MQLIPGEAGLGGLSSRWQLVEMCLSVRKQMEACNQVIFHAGKNANIPQKWLPLMRQGGMQPDVYHQADPRVPLREIDEYLEISRLQPRSRLIQSYSHEFLPENRYDQE